MRGTPDGRQAEGAVWRPKEGKVDPGDHCLMGQRSAMSTGGHCPTERLLLWRRTDGKRHVPRRVMLCA
jgi:hypothetical protein